MLDSNKDGYLSTSDDFNGAVLPDTLFRVAHLHGKQNVSLSEFVQTWEGTVPPEIAHKQSPAVHI